MRIAFNVRIVTAAAALFAAGACLAQSAALAAEYPSRPIRLVVPFAPGGTNDVLGRILAGKFSEGLGQQVVVDNRPGAGATIGSAIVARATPDGHTLLITGAGHAINPGIYRTLPYDTERDFAPISLVGGGSYVMVIHPSVPAKTAKEFVAWVKSRPGGVSYASAGVGNPTHLAAELLNIAAGIDMQHVPYKGGGAVMPDLLAGRVSLFFASISTAIAQVKAGKLRAIAVTTARRDPTMPEVPTFMESGFPDYEVSAWYGLFAPGKTPRPVVNRLNKELRQALADRETRERLQARGINPEPGTPQEFAALIRNDIAKWAKVVRAAGIKPE
jgi:tripartite-type tricarboxylate transporter receptor subunit TctC